jgi:hypothetical protein
MRDDIEEGVGVPFDAKVKTPASRHTGLPNIPLLIVWKCSQAKRQGSESKETYTST